MVPVDPASVDPLYIAAATLFATKAIEALGEEAGKRSWSVLQRVARLLWRKSAGDEEAEAALKMVQAQPTEDARIRLLAEVLQDRAEQDSKFKAALLELVTEAQAVGAVMIEAKNTDQVIGGNLNQIGTTNIGHDQINYPPPS